MKRISFVLILLILILAMGLPAEAKNPIISHQADPGFAAEDVCPNLTGAIWTTDPNGDKVDGNIYEKKDDVWLQGGPSKQGGTLPDGQYYYKVTDPSGAVNLYPDEYRTVEVINGTFFVPLMFYNDTPSEGGEYKAWLSKVPTFDGGCTKTDNFKVKKPTAVEPELKVSVNGREVTIEIFPPEIANGGILTLEQGDVTTYWDITSPFLTIEIEEGSARFTFWSPWLLEGPIYAYIP